MNFIHSELADGRWQQFSLDEQLGNVGSEISRAKNWESKNSEYFLNAIWRAIELLDLTIQDPKNRFRLEEICRAKEILCDIVFGENQYNTTLEDLDRYFTQFALAARKHFIQTHAKTVKNLDI